MGRRNNPALDAVRKPSSDEVAFFAGFYEGEGHCCRIKNTVSVHIAQKDPEVLHRLCECYGGRTWFLETNKHPHWRWAVYGSKASTFLFQIYPFLSKWRQLQVDRMNVGIGQLVDEIAKEKLDGTV